MSAVSFLTAVSPSGNESSGDTPTKDEKQEDDTRLKKGTVVFCQNDGSEGVACWQNEQIQRNLISFVVWGEDQSSCDFCSLGWRTALKKKLNDDYDHKWCFQVSFLFLFCCHFTNRLEYE